MPNLLLKSAGILLVAALVAFAGLLFSMPELSAQEADSDGEPAATPTPVPPTATPIPPTPTPRPDATIALSSRRVVWGSVITVRGEHFDPSVPLTVMIRSNARAVVGPRSWDITPSPTPQTDDRGSFEFEVALWYTDQGGHGSHTIDVYGTAAGVPRGSRARVSIVIPSLSLSATSGPPGAVIAVSGSDFYYPPGSTFRVTVSGVDVTPSPVPPIDSRGRMEFDIQIPDFSPGDHQVDLVVTNGATGTRHGNIEYFTVVSPPPPTITLSSNSGAPGSTITLRGEGFKTFVPVRSVLIGGEDINPSPAPATDAQGRTEFDLLVPCVSPGEYTIVVEVSDNAVRVVEVSDNTVSVNFTVTESDCLLAPGTPSPTITLSASSGAPGSRITLRGEGAKTYVPVRRVSIGGIDVLPSPAPATSGQGMFEFAILIPGLDSGRHTIEVQVSDTTARVGFTVTAASAPAPTATPWPTPIPPSAPTAEPPQLPGSGGTPPHIFIGTATLNGSPAGTGIAVDAYDSGRLIGATVTQAGGRFSIHVHRAEGVITFRVNNQAAAESWMAWRRGQVTTGFDLTAGGDGSNESDPARLFAAFPDLVRAFGFDNATKRWDFFDPAAADVSTLTRFMPQHSYWLLVSHTTRLLLNGVERDLFCVEDNCWNLIVW